jgi:hypothetical protein
MGRADIPEADRIPFYLYVDEFQNFATDSFATILSEARKYGLNLTVANQYISQMGEEVRGAVFGNVGTVMSFRVSPDDAPFLQKYFEPEFEAANLIQQHSRFFIISMMIDGEKAPAFSAKTLNLPEPPDDNTDQIIAETRQRYSRDRLEVELEVHEASGLSNMDNNQTAPKAPQPVHIVKLATGLTPPAKPSGAEPDEQQAAKRKRSRRRRGGGGQPQQPTTHEPTTAPQPTDDGQTIRLR